MPETTPLIKAALNLRGGAGFDVYYIIQEPADTTNGQLAQILTIQFNF